MGLDMYLTGKRYMSKYFDAADSEKIFLIFNEALQQVFSFDPILLNILSIYS